MQETLKNTNKTKSLTSFKRCGYKVKLNIFYAKENKKLQSGVRYYAANCKNDQNLNITAKELQLVTQIILQLEPFFCSKGM